MAVFRPAHPIPAAQHRASLNTRRGEIAMISVFGLPCVPVTVKESCLLALFAMGIYESHVSSQH